MCFSGAAGPLQPVGLSTEVVEALRYLMGFSADEGRLEEAEAYAMKLLDTSGPEKDPGRPQKVSLGSRTRPKRCFETFASR